MTAAPEHILVVDDELEICEIVRQYLESEGFRVTSAGDGTAMRRVLAQESVDLVIMDLMLPGEDGLTLARELRETMPQIGILILTGRGDTVDKIIGLEMGADDYLSKPFHLRELLARTKSVLRRVAVAAPREEEKRQPSHAHFAGWGLDLVTRVLTSPKGQEVHLTTGEFDLLAAFVVHPSQILSRERLLDLARNREAGPFDRTIDVQVGRLRRKLGDNSQNPVLIKTVRGSGYIFTPAVQLS